MKVEFSKMSGAGNDFIVLGPTYSALKTKASDLARRLCPRRTAVGADGLIIIEQSDGLVMHYYNGDGSEARFCGNGARCMAVYCDAKGIATGKIAFRSGSGSHIGQVFEGGARVSIASARLEKEFAIGVDGESHLIHLVDAGVPHAVVICEVIDQIDVGSLGKRIRRHPAVGKEGANVDFVTDGRSGEIWIRTYERGVEKETLACGSGCVAAAHLLRSRGLAGDVVTLIAVSGDRLKVELPKGEGQSSYLSGPARIIYEGLIDIDI